LGIPTPQFTGEEELSLNTIQENMTVDNNICGGSYSIRLCGMVHARVGQKLVKGIKLQVLQVV
jgi:hypothetical protein